MSLGYRVDKQPTWHPIWRARYRVAVDCRPEVPVPRSTDRLLPGFVDTFCGAGLRPVPAIRARWRGTIRRFLRLSSHLGGLTLIPTRRPYRQNSAVFVHPGRSTQELPPLRALNDWSAKAGTAVRNLEFRDGHRGVLSPQRPDISSLPDSLPGRSAASRTCALRSRPS